MQCCSSEVTQQVNLPVLDDTGYTSTIYYISGSPPLACKVFKAQYASAHCPVETSVYKRFMSAPFVPAPIPRFHGSHPSIPNSLLLHYLPKGNLWKYIDNLKRGGQAHLPRVQIYKWAKQACAAFSFTHSLGILNSDIHPVNFLLDEDLNLKVRDWAGASINGSKARSLYRVKCSLFELLHNPDERPGRKVRNVAREDGVSARTEIFALASSLFYIIRGVEPWNDLSERDDREEITWRIASTRFPRADEMPILGSVITKCWLGEFLEMDDVGKAIRDDELSNVDLQDDTIDLL